MLYTKLRFHLYQAETLYAPKDITLLE